VLTLVAFATVPATAWALDRTRLGLRIRFAGEAPAAADALGVNPNTQRTIALAISGALGALGGVYLVTVASNLYTEGQTGGRGFIGMATVIFGNWQPGGTGLGALLFGLTDALRTRQEGTVGALVLVAGLVLAGFAARQAARGRRRAAASTGLVAIGLLAWIGLVGVIPAEFVAFAPQLATLLVLAFARQTLRPPAAAGLPYRRGDHA
jgi:simple sugar transport system permease protein